MEDITKHGVHIPRFEMTSPSMNRMQVRRKIRKNNFNFESPRHLAAWKDIAMDVPITNTNLQTHNGHVHYDKTDFTLPSFHSNCNVCVCVCGLLKLIARQVSATAWPGHNAILTQTAYHESSFPITVTCTYITPDPHLSALEVRFSWRGAIQINTNLPHLTLPDVDVLKSPKLTRNLLKTLQLRFQ